MAEKHAIFTDKAEEQSCVPSLQFQGCTYFLTKLWWKADLLLCVLLNVSHLAGGSSLGPLKQQQHGDGEGWKIRCQCLTVPTGILTRTCIKKKAHSLILYFASMQFENDDSEVVCVNENKRKDVWGFFST